MTASAKCRDCAYGVCVGCAEGGCECDCPKRPLIHRDPTPEEAARQPILTPAEQLAAALPGAVMPEVTKPAEVSPTGTPLVPVRAVPYVVALITILGTVGALPTMGISLIPVAICNGCLAAAAILGALAGVASPGLRKQP